MEIRSFGKTNEGMDALLYTIENDAIKISVCNYGATLVSLVLKHKGIDVVQGFTCVQGYQNEVQYMGQTIGRVCNRIGKGVFTLNDVEYHVPTNNNGNSLHGGDHGFDQKIWSVDVQGDKIICTYLSPDGEEGYPGNCNVTVAYTLLDDGIRFDYEGTTDKDTLFNITNHSFFNLDGPTSESVLEHKIKINANYFAGVDENGCTHDEIYQVKDTAFDFMEFKTIGQDINNDEIQLKNGSGYDHHFLVFGEGFRKFAVCQGKNVEMTIFSDCPGVHLYSSNFLDGTSVHGKEGGKFPYRSSICFETQYYPNAIQTESFEKPILRKGEVCHHKTEFRFL